MYVCTVCTHVCMYVCMYMYIRMYVGMHVSDQIEGNHLMAVTKDSCSPDGAAEPEAPTNKVHSLRLGIYMYVCMYACK